MSNLRHPKTAERQLPKRNAPDVDHAHPQSAGQVDVLALQRVVGNHAVNSLLQSGTHDSRTAGTHTSPVVDAVLKNSTGQPLEPTTRAFMESRFNHDFSQVRLHTGTAAAKASQALSANAFTVGRNVVFNRPYDPNSNTGRSVLAHELAHVIQQEGAPRDAGEIRPAGDEYEQAADVAAQAVAQGQTTMVRSNTGVTGPQLQQTESKAKSQEELEARLRQAYISLAAQHVAGINEALTSGYIWWFEEEFFTGKTEGEVNTLEQRNETLRKLARYLQEFIEAIKAGERYWTLRQRWLDSSSMSPQFEEVEKSSLSLAFSEFLEEKHGISYKDKLPYFEHSAATLSSYVFFGPTRTPILPPSEPSGVGSVKPQSTEKRQAKPPSSSTSESATSKKKPPVKKSEVKEQVAPPKKAKAAPNEIAAPAQESMSPVPDTKPIPELEQPGKTVDIPLDLEHGYWFVELLDPEAHPETVSRLLTADDARYYPGTKQGKIIKNPPYRFPLEREGSGDRRFYYVYNGKKVYLPNLLTRRPGAAQPPD